MSRRLAALMLLSVATVGSADVVAYDAEGSYREFGYSAELLWNEGSYVVDITTDLGDEERNLTRARYEAERRVDDALPAILVQSLADFPLSSVETVGSRLRERPLVLGQLRELAAEAAKTRSHLDGELARLQVRYTIPLYGEGSILAVFVTHERSAPIRRFLAFAPSKDYTGLIIYARGEYSAWGEPGVARGVTPCLFPRVFDTDMQLVIDLERMDPAAVVAWGAVLYVNSLDAPEVSGRAGSDPLRVMARGVFGVNSTDLIIPRETARSLLCRQSTRELLRRGNIVVVLDAPSP
jgi:hypothetical protein